MKKNQIKKMLWLTLIPIAFSSSMIAVACAKTEVPQDLIKDRSTPIKINLPYSTQENTADEIIVAAKLDENHNSKVFSIDHQKYNDVKYKFLDIKIETLKDGVELIVLTVQAKFEDYDLPHIYTHYYRFLTKQQKEIKNKRIENENAIKSLIADEEKNGFDFLKIQIKDEYKNKTLEEIKIIGDDALLINNQQPNYLSKPNQEGISFEIIDLNITFHKSEQENSKLIARIKISKGKENEKVELIYSLFIN